MFSSRTFIGRVQSFSPSREHWVSKALTELPEKVTVRFGTDQSAVLDLTDPRARHWANIVDKLTSTNRPVYLEIDEETGIITKLLIPIVYTVEALADDENGDLMVRLMPSSAIHHLLRSDPNYDTIRASLQAALDTKTEVLMTETRDEHEIIDVRRPAATSGDPPDPTPMPPPDPPVSEARASQLFNDANAQSCDPCNPSSDCIPFRYPDDGCWARAHRMCYDMVGVGEDPEKVWITANTRLVAPTPNHPDCYVEWGWHVAPTLMVSLPAGDDKRVIDPSLSPGPESKDAWKARQGDPAATMRDSTWTEYWGIGTTDPALTDTNNWLDHYRSLLQDRCNDFGPPPYSCTQDCFFIIDRDTFSDSEIEAMLHLAAPAAVEAAFYIVIDGFSPYELGFTSATMEKTPTLNIAPLVPGMTIDADHMVFEYPNHLNRRQRLTWVYTITFANVTGFTAERLVVTLQASMSLVSSVGTLYLIKQPNPYEIDGATSWLSTDLRVFQIMAGESRFGTAMASDPSAFITRVIANLNNAAPGGQTFEASISTDQNTSRVELSQTVAGVPVYNFAVAKVRYRALALSATDVRVFFRLFPVATTSLEYDQATAYRRYEQLGVIVPLLGMSNGEIAAIPCFAAPRIDSATASMTTQTDPANVQTMPPNPTGAEVVCYFGCWLDINQTQAQFPIQPSPVDGPFTADRLAIQDLIRNAHQCLVSEIAFTPAPVQPGATPSVSDKLAQRNLAIVESANPGLVSSRRVPQTFQIRPTSTKTEPDELMIDWGDVPAGTHATLYLPGVDTNEMLLMAARKYRAHRLARIDQHTLKCNAGGITYVPLPAVSANLPGLLTVDLPAGIKSGQAFRVVVRQVTAGRLRESGSAAPRAGTRRIVGSFQVTIPVREKSAMLPREERLLSNLRWIQRAIPAKNRWAPVFNKYVGYVANRVDALGGRSKRVAPSPSGEWRAAYRRCRLFGLTVVVLLAVLAIVIGTQGGGTVGLVAVAVAAFLAGTVRLWTKRCRPRICEMLMALSTGVGLGAIVLAILLVLGTSAPQLAATLVTSAVAAVGAGLVGWAKGCFD